MAGDASGIRAGRAYVEIGANAGPLDSVLRSTQGRLLAFSQNIRKIGFQLMTLGVGLGAGLGYVVKQASNAEETWASFKAVFQGLTDEAEAFAVATANAIGRSPQELRVALMQFQALGKSLGYNEAQAFRMSKAMTQAGIDLAAFWNVDEEEIFQRLRSGITGSVEAMGRYGVEMHEAAVNTQLLKMGINKTTATATEQEKVMARLAIIMKSVNDIGAKGQALKEAGSFANQWRRLKAEFQETAIAAGKALLPAITGLVGGLGTLFGAVKKYIDANPQAVVALAQFASGAFASGLALVTLGYALPAIGTGLALIVGLMGALLTPVGAVAAGVTAISASMLLMSSEGKSAISGMLADFGNLSENLMGIWQGIKDAIGSGDLGLAGQIAMSSLHLAWLSGCQLLQDTLSTSLIYMEGMWDGAQTAFAGAFVALGAAWTATTSGIEGAFDTLASNIGGIWQAVISNLKAGLDIFLTSMTDAMAEAGFKMREAKVAMSMLYGKKGAYDLIQSEREAYQAKSKAGAEERASQRQADINGAYDQEGLDKRRKERQERNGNAKGTIDTLNEDAATRAKERQDRIDSVGATDPKVAAAQKELEDLLQKARDQKIEADIKRAEMVAPGQEGPIDPRGGMASTDTKHPAANIQGSAGAAATIAKSMTHKAEPVVQEVQKSNALLKTACDSLKTLIKKPVWEVTEIA